MIPAAAWILSLLGLAVSWIIMLGHAMTTVPSKLSVVPALGLSLLPVAGLLIVIWGIKSAPPQKIGNAFLIYTLPGLISLFTLLSIVSSMEHRWLKKFQRDPLDFSHLTVATFEPVPGAPLTDFEIRRVVSSAVPGATSISLRDSDEERFVDEETILSAADVISTSVEGPYSLTGHAVKIAFSPEAGDRVYEQSKLDDGNEWAVILNEEIIATAKVRWPIREKIVIEANFDEETARSIAKRIVQAQ